MCFKIIHKQEGDEMGGGIDKKKIAFYYVIAGWWVHVSLLF